jgi:hypothetical protein
MNTIELDNLLKYLSEKGDCYQTAGAIKNEVELDKNIILDILVFLEDDGYVKKSIRPNEVNRMENHEGLKPMEYWKISLKGMYFISEGGYIKLVRHRRKVSILTNFGVYGGMIIALYASLNICRDYLLPFFDWLFSCA